MTNQLTPGVQRILRNSFRDIGAEGYLGMARGSFSQADADKIVEGYRKAPKDQGQRQVVDNYLVRVCASEEYFPQEFRLALEIERRMDGMTTFLPEAKALIQVGSLRDLAVGEASMLYVTKNPEGRGLLSHFNKEDLDYLQTSDLLRNLMEGIQTYRERNVFLMDFSPEDVMIHLGPGLAGEEVYHPVLVKTQNARFGDEIHANILIEKQMTKFGEAYRPFLRHDLMEWCLRLLEINRAW
jgi:hypothetical protein